MARKPSRQCSDEVPSFCHKNLEVEWRLGLETRAHDKLSWVFPDPMPGAFSSIYCVVHINSDSPPVKGPGACVRIAWSYCRSSPLLGWSVGRALTSATQP